MQVMSVNNTQQQNQGVSFGMIYPSEKIGPNAVKIVSSAAERVSERYKDTDVFVTRGKNQVRILMQKVLPEDVEKPSLLSKLFKKTPTPATKEYEYIEANGLVNPDALTSVNKFMDALATVYSKKQYKTTSKIA